MSRKYKLYTPYQMEKMTEKAIRKAYSALRSVANKRLERMRKLNIGMRAREGFRFPTIQQIEESSKWTVSSALADVSRWLRSDRTTVKGEKQAVAKFQTVISNLGYPELVKDLDTTYQTMEYLDYMRDQYTANLYSSNDVLDIVEQAELLNVSKEVLDENIKLFYDHKEEFLNIKGSKHKGYTPTEVYKMIGKYSRNYK